MSLEDSLTLAEAYKLPTSQINYLFLIQLIGQGKVCSSQWKYDDTKFKLFPLMCPRFTDWKSFMLLSDRGVHDCHEKAALCRGGMCD